MHFRLFVFAYVMSIMVSFSQPNKSVVRLQEKIQSELLKQKGVFSLAWKDLSSGAQILINENETFHAASTMKTPVMIEVFKQAREGRFSLNDSVAIVNKFKSIVDGSDYQLTRESDSEQTLYEQLGGKKQLLALLDDMITMSSNLATNIIIQLVDAKKVTQTMQRIGAKDTQVLRGVEDQKAFEKGLNNVTTAFDQMIIYEKIARDQLLNKQDCEAMVDILLKQHFNEIIPAGLPSPVKVAHKTGNITGVQHDAGIVFLSDGRKYILVMLSKNLQDEKEAITSMALISEMIYQEMY